MTERIFNFAAGPAVLPLPVLEEARENLLSLPGVGMSVLEISHRSKTFQEIIETTEADIRRLAGIPGNYRVLFIQGGASMQFSMVPMNSLGSKGKADYVLTGSWSKKAVKEALKVGQVNVAATTEPEGFKRIPVQSEIKLDPDAAYVHITSNNTLFGTEPARCRWLRTPRRICSAGQSTLPGTA
jgi:phosphoserine aminotransferase